jgi:hypothetical protein
VQPLKFILSGLGLAPNGKRTVTPIPANLLNLVPSPQGKNEVVKSSDADPERDTLPMIMRNVRRQKWQGAKLAKALKGSSRHATVKNIYDFIFNHIQYEQDPSGSETVRSLRRLVADKKGDCDCFSSAIANLLLNLDIPFAFRIAAYNGSSDYSHIYIVVPKAGNSLASGYYTIDPVVHRFNYEVPFSKKKDFNMNLKSLDGLAACESDKGKNGKRKLLTMPASQLASMGLVSTEKVLADANIPFTATVVDGAPAYQVGNQTVAGFVQQTDAPALVSSLQTQLASQQTQQEQAQADAQKTTTKEAKAAGLVALGLLAFAAIANEFKSKPGVNGLGAPRKKIASFQI